MLKSLEVWKRFKNGYQFFKKSERPDPNKYLNWKNQSILKCGPKWDLEVDDPMASSIAKARQQSNPYVKDILIQMSLIYRERVESDPSQQPNAPWEVRPQRIRKIAKLVGNNRESNMLITTAQVPKLSGDPARDEKEYIAILSKCLELFKKQSLDEIVNGDCGMESE